MPVNLTDEIDRVFATYGASSYGEDVSQRDHALQCALLAQVDGACDHLVAAALLHDYGHLRDDNDEALHQIHGARALRSWFGPQVRRPVALHVLAKRYLCAVEPDYEASLSAASIRTLGLQGGRLTAAQCRRFAASPFAADALKLRRWDDAAKVVGQPTPGLEQYFPLLDRIAIAP